MKNTRNEIKLNIINDYGYEWFGITFEAWRIEISKDELSYNTKINILDEIVGVDSVEVLENTVLVELHKYEYENVFDNEYLKEIIDNYKNRLEKAIDKSGIEKKYTIIFDFFNDNSNYHRRLEEGKNYGIPMNNKLINVSANNEFSLEEITPKRKKWSINIANIIEDIAVSKAIVKIDNNKSDFNICLDTEFKIILEVSIVIDTNDINYFVRELENIQDNIEKQLRKLDIEQFEIFFE